MEQNVHLQCRAKLVAWDYRAPSFDGFGGKVGLGQDVVRLANGEMLMVFSAGYWHMSPASPFVVPTEKLESFTKNGFRHDHVAPNGGRIMGIRSADSGETWSDPFDILVYETDVSPQGIDVLPDGTVLVFVNNQASWYGYKHAPPGHMAVNTRTGCIHSKDHGRSWSEVFWFDCPYPFYQRGYCNAVQVDEDTLLYACYASAGSTDSQLYGVIQQSKDNGASWEVLSTIEREDGNNIDEPAMCFLPSGKLILLTRPDGAIFYSQDKGRSWAYSHKPIWDEAEKTRRSDNIKAPRMALLNDGTLVCYMTIYGKLGISWSTDEGKSWKTQPDGRAFLIDPETYGYPGGCVLEDGSILIVYYDATFKQQRTTVWAIRVRISEDRESFDILPSPGVGMQQRIGGSGSEVDGTLDIDVM